MRTMFTASFFTIVSIPLTAGSAWGQAREWGGPWGWHYMWGTMGVGMMLFMFLFWILVIVGVVALIRWLWGTGSGPHGIVRTGETAEDILKKRYAQGEIDKDEFEAKLRDLRQL